MKIRFNDLTINGSPEQCYMELCDFRHVIATVINKTGCRRALFVLNTVHGTCSFFDLKNYLLGNLDVLRASMPQHDFVVLRDFIVTFPIHPEASNDRCYLSNELGQACPAEMESAATDDGALTVGFDFPRGRYVLHALKMSESNVAHEKETVCVTRMEHFDDDIVKRVLYCNASADLPEKGFVSDDHGNKHFLLQGRCGKGVSDWVRERRFIDAEENLKSKFLPGIKFGVGDYCDYERKALHLAMQDGHYSEAAIDGSEVDLAVPIGVSRQKLTSRVHLCLRSRTLHLYPCD